MVVRTSHKTPQGLVITREQAGAELGQAEDNLKNEDDFKNEDDLKMKTTCHYF